MFAFLLHIYRFSLTHRLDSPVRAVEPPARDDLLLLLPPLQVDDAVLGRRVTLHCMKNNTKEARIDSKRIDYDAYHTNLQKNGNCDCCSVISLLCRRKKKSNINCYANAANIFYKTSETEQLNELGLLHGCSTSFSIIFSSRDDVRKA